MTTCEWMFDDAHSIEHLYQSYQRPILAYLIRLVNDREAAEDLCQETFIKAMRGWENRNVAASVTSWLYRIATNTAYDYLRRRRRIAFLPLLEALPLCAACPLEAQIETDEPVQSALAQLPTHYRVPLVLHTCEGHSLQDIADTLGCSVNTIKSRLHRARERFRQVYVE